MSWYQDGYFWRKPNDDGSNGKGDLIFNTCNKIIEDGDRSLWAFASINICAGSLRRRERWPDGEEWEHYNDVDTWAQRIVNLAWNKFRFWIYKRSGRYIGKRLPFRYQGRMTRDPFIAWGAACAQRCYLIKAYRVSPPWYIYTPSFWAWWKYIITHDEKYLKRYRFWRQYSRPKKDFVIRLNELREQAIQLIQSQKSTP